MPDPYTNPAFVNAGNQAYSQNAPLAFNGSMRTPPVQGMPDQSQGQTGFGSVLQKIQYMQQMQRAKDMQRGPQSLSSYPPNQ